MSCCFGNGIFFFPQGSTFRACVVMPSRGGRCFLHYGVCCLRGEREEPHSSGVPTTHQRFSIAALLSSCPSPFQLGLGSGRASPAALNPSQSALGSLWSCQGASSSPGFVFPIAALPRVSCGHENHPQADAETPLCWESAQPLQPLGLCVVKGRSSSRLSSCFPL